MQPWAIRLLICSAVVGLAVPQARAQLSEVAMEGTFRVIRKRDRFPICTSSWEIRHRGAESNFFERGEGTCHGYKAPVSWVSDTRVLSADPSQLIETYRKISTIDRMTLLRYSTRRFDRAAGVVTAETINYPADSRGKEKVERGRWEGLTGIATPTSLLFVIRGELAQGRLPGKVKLVTSEPGMYTVRYVQRGQERITVPSGTYDCVKIELLIDLGFISWFRPLLPKFYLWYTEAAPHHWIRYEGLEDGLASPKVIIERISPLPAE